jgi:protein involved in polysaccharide export with SLBB domain
VLPITPGAPTPQPPGTPPTQPGVQPPTPPGTQPSAPPEGVTPPPTEETPEQPPVEPPIIPLFGHDLFAAAEEQPVTPSLAPPPPTYVMGPGDQVELRVWGRGIEYVTVVQPVTNDGAIYGPSVGRIPLAGKTIAEAQAGILASYRGFYPECEVALTISVLRSIEVMVIGDVAHPGRKTLPGTATVFTALYAAGGPLDSGSLRKVDVRRGTQLVTTFDLYAYLLRGDTSGDVTLQGGDTVFVHVIGPVVAVTGEVRRQARYEIGDGATLAEALDMAGGIRGSGYAQRVQVKRAEQNTQRVVVEADLVSEAEKWRAVELRDGDEVVVLPVLEELRNAVTVEGAVRRPDVYAWAEGMTISKVIQQAEGLTPEALRDPVDILRESPQGMRDAIKVNLGEVLAGRAADVALQPRDIVRVLAIPEVQPNVVYAEGAVVTPGEKEFHRGMTAADLVRAAGGLTNGAYGEAATLVRKDVNFQDTYVVVPIGKIMSGMTDLDVPLRNRDKLVVSLSAEKTRLRFVEIAGAVAHPDRYPFGEDMKLSDLVRLAGGLLPEADGKVSIIRGQTPGASETVDVDGAALKAGGALADDPVLQEGDTVAVQSVGGFSVEGQFAEVRGRVARPGVYPLIGDDGSKLRVSELVDRAGGLLPDAYPEMAAVYHTERSLLDRRSRAATVKGALQESESVIADEQEGNPATLYNPAKGEPMVPREARERLAQMISGGKGEAFIVLPPRPLGDVRVTTGVPVDLTLAERRRGSRIDPELQSGDILTVFQKPDTVMVDGAVAAPGPQPFVAGAAIRQYLYEAGQPTRDADVRFAVVIHYNGQARRMHPGDRVEPGDWILVPTKYTVHKVSGAAGTPLAEQLTNILSTLVILRKL